MNRKTRSGVPPDIRNLYVWAKNLLCSIIYCVVYSTLNYETLFSVIPTKVGIQTCPRASGGSIDKKEGLDPRS